MLRSLFSARTSFGRSTQLLSRRLQSSGRKKASLAATVGKSGSSTKWVLAALGGLGTYGYVKSGPLESDDGGLEVARRTPSDTVRGLVNGLVNNSMHLATSSGGIGGDGVAAKAFMGLLAMGGLATVVTMLYKKCPPNQLLIVYGWGQGIIPSMSRGYRMVQGGGTIIIPVLQSFQALPLSPFAIEIPLQDALSKEKVRVSVPSNFTIAVGTNPEIAEMAATRLLDLEMEDIQLQANEIITGQLRQVIATLTIEEINEDRKQFESAVKEQCAKELNKIGLEMINVNITNIVDASGILINLGKRKAAEVNSEAEISVQNAKKNEAIGVETQRREQDIAVSQQQRDREIGTRLAEQESTVERARLEALEVKGRNASAQAIAISNAELQKAKAESYQIGETAEKLAEAAVVEAKAFADAKAAKATAQRVEAEERARVEAPAIANKAKLVVDAAAEAEVTRLTAQGEADAIYAKAEAEARGIRAVLQQKAVGLGDLVERTHGPDHATRMLLLEQLPVLAKTSADAISNVKMDKVVVWDNGHAKGPDGEPASAVSNFVRSLTSMMPPTASILQEIGGLEGLTALTGQPAATPKEVTTKDTIEFGAKDVPKDEDTEATSK